MPILKEQSAPGGGQLYNEPGFQTDGAPTNSLLSRSLDARVSKNVLVSSGDSYLTSQEAIDNADPAGAFRDTVALRGFQGRYQLGENSLIVDGTGATFSPDQVVDIGIQGLTTAFNHALLGGSYAGNITITSHNGGTANKLTITELIISDSSALNFVLSFAQAGGLIDVVELVRARGVKTINAGNVYGNGLINFRGNTYQGHRPIRLNLRSCKLSNLAGPVFTGIAPRGTTIHLYDDTEVIGNSASNLQRVRSADEAGSTVAYTDAEIIVDERSAPGSSTPGTPAATPFGPLPATGNAGETFSLPAGTKSVRGVVLYVANPGPAQSPTLALTSNMYTLDTTATPPTIQLLFPSQLDAGDLLEGIAFATVSTPAPDTGGGTPPDGSGTYASQDYFAQDYNSN